MRASRRLAKPSIRRAALKVMARAKKPAVAGFFAFDGQCLPNDGDGVTDIRGKHHYAIFLALLVTLANSHVAAAGAVIKRPAEGRIR